MDRSSSILALCLLVGIAILAALSGAVVGPTVTGEVGATAASDADLSLAQSGEVDNEQFRLTINEDGTAQWTFRSNRYLADESEVEGFESFAGEFNADDEHPLFVDFREQASTLVGNADGELEREMTARDFEREAYVDTDTQGNEVGVVEMSFYWEGFARIDGDRVVVGDIYEGGHYIGPDQWIVFEAGDGLAFTEYDPQSAELSGETLADSETVIWRGEETFVENRPRAVLRPADEVASENQDEVDDTDALDPETGSDDDGGQADDPWMLAAGIVVLVVGLGTIVAWRRDTTILDRLASSPNGGDTTGTTSKPDQAPAVPEEELLTDEARVTNLLEENGGRMKQVRIVEETGWSKSKVSMLLSDMEDEGDISKLRVGRENIISLDGHEPEAAGSPFEDE